MDARITTDAAEVATLLAGGTVSACGDGTVGGDESCDGADLAGADCTTLGFASGTLGCTAGCGLDVSACAASDCGNGVVDAGEDCDLGNLNGGTCTSEGQYGDGLSCGVGCVYDTSACPATRYEDTGLGSVIDHQTGLEWQKTDDAGGLTDKNNTYTWSSLLNEPDGTAFTVFLATLNEVSPGSCSSGGPTGGCCPNAACENPGCYAGHCDWRLPTVVELQTILLEPFPCDTIPCIDESAFGPTALAVEYWSASTSSNNSDVAWTVFFFDGFTPGKVKDNDSQVRAVRGGS
jgi:hypothetical protein